MDGWMDGWMDERFDGCLSVCLSVCMHACMHACMHVCVCVCVCARFKCFVPSVEQRLLVHRVLLNAEGRDSIQQPSGSEATDSYCCFGKDIAVLFNEQT